MAAKSRRRDDDALVQTAGLQLTTLGALGFGEPGKKLVTLTLTMDQARDLAALGATYDEHTPDRGEGVLAAYILLQSIGRAVERLP